VLPLDAGTCPLGEVARVARYLAAESSGQCGPCKLGLPGVARALSAVADGSGGLGALEVARRSAGAVRGRGACRHPDGTARFALSALDAFPADLAAHVFRGGCGRPVRGVLPLPAAEAQTRLVVDWTRCAGHGLCGRLVPELVQLDRQGYPAFLDMPVPYWLERDAQQAVAMCPALALRVERGAVAALPAGSGAGMPGPASGPVRGLTR
jgi:ferredoxin